MTKAKILINLFHPNMDNSRGNKILLEKVNGLDNVTLRDIYVKYPDYKIDVKQEQQFLLDNDLIVFQHPFYWYSCPSLLKEWEDKVLEQGFAYPPGVGDKLNGKQWLTVLTTGGPEDAYCSGGYNNFTISELLRPFQQTANLCGMKWLTPMVIHSVLPEGIEGYKNVSNEEITTFANKYRKFLYEYVVEQNR
jgi:glutathione-regulated potassium-efflux system ancillary protein KefG